MIKINRRLFLIKPKAIALMVTASFCAGVRHKRYSGQQEKAPQCIKIKKVQLISAEPFGVN